MKMMLDRGGWYQAFNALVTGRVEVGEGSSLWFGACARGDDAAIRIGRRTNLQDFVMAHPEPGEDLEIGDDVMVGHRAILHGRRVGSRCVVGMGAILLGGSVLGDDCLVAAGAVVPEGAVAEDGWVLMGVPAKPVRRAGDRERAYVARWVPHYVESARRYGAVDVP